jgi:flavin reductase (DIM6/NTAB) family NADH-FMN oxidoreductase RutF
MVPTDTSNLIELDTDRSIWERFFTVFSLVVIGTTDDRGVIDLAPKHLAIPLSWEAHFGFVCTSTHRTYQNVKKTREFTVSYPRPSQAVLASLAATPRDEDGGKPITEALPTVPARAVSGVLLRDAYLFLECRLVAVYDDFGENSLIAGRIVAARVAADALRQSDEDDQDLLERSPLIAYLHPGRFTEVAHSSTLPLPSGFRR